MHCVGFTDASWLRAAFPEVVAYDFDPTSRRATPTSSQGTRGRRMHPVRDLAFQAFFAEQVALELLRPAQKANGGLSTGR